MCHQIDSLTSIGGLITAELVICSIWEDHRCDQMRKSPALQHVRLCSEFAETSCQRSLHPLAHPFASPLDDCASNGLHSPSLSYKLAQNSFGMGYIRQRPWVLDDSVRTAAFGVRITLTLCVMSTIHYIFKNFICVSMCSIMCMHGFLALLISEIFMGPRGNATGSFRYRYVYWTLYSYSMVNLTRQTAVNQYLKPVHRHPDTPSPRTQHTAQYHSSRNVPLTDGSPCFNHSFYWHFTRLSTLQAPGHLTRSPFA